MFAFVVIARSLSPSPSSSSPRDRPPPARSAPAARPRPTCARSRSGRSTSPAASAGCPTCRPAGPVPQGAAPGRARLRAGRLVRQPTRRLQARPGIRRSVHRLRLRRILVHDLRHRLRADPDASGLQVREHRRQRRVHDRHGGHRRLQRACASGPGIPGSCGAGPIRWWRRRPSPSTPGSSRSSVSSPCRRRRSTCCGARARRR